MTHSFRQAIEETLPWLSSFGADPTGGLTRLLYSPEWLQAQQAFKQKMSDSGLETRFDEVGNLYGRLPGSRFPDDVILSGSHIDSVVNGGNLGGLAGGPLAKRDLRGAAAYRGGAGVSGRRRQPLPLRLLGQQKYRRHR